MATEVLMPALSPTMTEGKIARWLKSEGDKVKAGDMLAEIETDKATMEVEAVDEGMLAKIVVPEGTEHVAVNTPIAVIAGERRRRRPPPTGRRPAATRRAAPPASRAEARAPQPAAAPAPPAPAHAAPAAEPEYTGATRTITVREALARRDRRRDAARRRRCS